MSISIRVELVGWSLRRLSRAVARRPTKLRLPRPRGRPAPVAAAEEQVVNVYNWSDYIDPDTLEKFAADTGIKVRYDVFDNNEIVEAKLLAGNTGYDVVVPSHRSWQLQIDGGRAPQARSLQAAELDATSTRTACSASACTIRATSTRSTGCGAPTARLQRRQGQGAHADAPLDGWDLVFDPKIISKFKDCGVSFLDAPTELLAAILAYLGKTRTARTRPTSSWSRRR